MTNKKRCPVIRRLQGKHIKKIFKLVVSKYNTISQFFVKPDLQKQLEALNKVLFEKRRAAGFMGGGR